MEDFVIMGGLVAVVCILFVAICDAMIRGRKATLCDAKPGEVFNFEYLQPLNGERKRWLAEVVEPVQYRSDRKLENMNRASTYRKNDPDFQRTNHLVTCKTGDGEVRQFYCERAVNCRKPLFASFAR